MRISTRIPDFKRPALEAYLIGQALEGLARGCAPLLLISPLPPLYESGVLYRLEPGHGGGEEDFALPWETYSRGWGDCDDLIIWRVAELRSRDEKATVRADFDGSAMHVRVRRANGELEDPSVLLATREAMS